ncbi:MAG TPA: DUF4932 domain-containing protein [Mucilaginibacter sp.]|nr:DUF4932 domain-containing protein [Mucilaginibacter sp.]
MKKVTLLVLLFSAQYCIAQYKDQLSTKVSVAVNTNLETCFFAEKLAVEHLNHFVIDHKGWDYAHQPIVYYGFLHFKYYLNTPVILKIADLLKQIESTYHDNYPIMSYLVNQKEFPSKGPLFNEFPIDPDHPEMRAVLAELTDSLRSFYHLANVGGFIRENAPFYQGALKEVEKDIDVPSFPALEKWYGKTFPQYQIYLAPAMPITKGEDNYRGVGPKIVSNKGIIPAMIMSSDQMLPLKPNLTLYTHFGFDNPDITHLLTKHEIGHSFVNPILEKYASQIKSDSALFTPELKQLLAPHAINNWYVCVIEHLVRLAEIRTAVSMKDFKEAERLRKLHIHDYNCVLIPLLETKVSEYEHNRNKYPDFESYLPQLVSYLHSLTPSIINEQIKIFK